MTTADNFLTGRALDFEVEGRRVLEESDVSVIGNIELRSFRGVDAGLGAPVSIEAMTCIDISGTDLIDVNGEVVTPSDRDDLVALAVTFVGSSSGLLISESTAVSSMQCST